MKCPRCQHENPSDSAFCDECGVRLEAACPACDEANRPGAKFCRKCGQELSGAVAAPPTARKFASPESYTPRHLAERILTSRAALEGERKQVTVLFADVKGSMELLADRDPEEARKLLDPVLERMMEAVHRYEGTVNQVMGDGIMALFGAPLAHEDHAVRACYAALRMQRAIRRYTDDVRRAHGVEVQIRVGINSGEVVVRSVGSDLRTDYTAVGQTTHLAARMEQLATPGTVRLTAETVALAEGYIEVKPLGPVPIKGVAAPVEVYEVTGAGPARTRLQASARRGLTRFVGRDAELEQLRRVLELAGAGHGQVVAVVGEAGVGKSRLFYEFTRSHRLHGWLALESVSVPYGKMTSYLPAIDLLKGYFKIQDRDDLREVREKVTGKLLALDESLRPTLPALLALLDVPVEDAAWQALDPGQRRERTLDAVKRLVLRETREQPVLLIFEDLHWIDGATQALLDVLAESLGSARLLLLVNYRPEYQHPWGSKTYYCQMRLDALPAESAGELLEALLGGDPGLGPLKQLLVRRGNPFFLEESVRTLMETKALAGERGRYRLAQPVQRIQVPTTVQVMLAARIDRLSPEDKRLLQVASVIGKDVPFALLRAITDLPDEALRRGLDRLQSAELLYETRVFPDPEYGFKHALTHDVTYGSLLHDRRRELHARIVDAIETLYPDRLGEHIERLAHHALRGELREQAVGYLRQAGRKAAARSALHDARLWFEHALGVLEALPESPSMLEQAIEARVELRPVLNQLGELRETLERLREAESLAERLGDDRQRGRVYAFTTNIHSQLGELDEAFAAGARALTIAERLSDLRLRILATSYLEQAHYLRGEYERVVDLVPDNVARVPADWAYEAFGNVAPASIYDRFWLVMSLAELGRLAAAAPVEAEMIRLAAGTDHAFTVGVAHYAAATLHVVEGNWARARAMLDHGITAIRAGHLVLLLPHMVAASAWVLAQLGERGEALDRLREGQQLLEDYHAGSGFVGGWACHSLGQGCLRLGRLDEARSLGDRAVKFSRQQPGFTAHALHLLGDVATAPDRFDAERGDALYRQALAIAERGGMRPLVAHCHLGLGKLYRRTGKRIESNEQFATATTMCREMGMTYWLEKIRREIKEFESDV